jgi:hypothetical protein
MKDAFAFLVIGGLVSYLGITLGSWWHLLHWFSISCFALSAGYAGLGARVFGKGPDGRIPAWSRVIHFPYMVYSEVVWQFARALNRENPTDNISDDLILGRRLRSDERPAGIANYMDLTSEFEDPKNIRESENYITLPILDAGVPELSTLHAIISQLRPVVRAEQYASAIPENIHRRKR